MRAVHHCSSVMEGFAFGPQSSALLTQCVSVSDTTTSGGFRIFEA